MEQSQTVTEQQRQVAQQPVSEYECSMCGRDGGPHQGCELCHGNPRFFQQRNFTLSEERQGKNPDAAKDRYGPYGEVGPKIVVLPGGGMPGQQAPTPPEPREATKASDSQGE